MLLQHVRTGLVGGVLAALTVSLVGGVPATAATSLCGATITRDIRVTTDQTCTDSTITLAPGVALDLAGHTLTGGTLVVAEHSEVSQAPTSISNGRLRSAELRYLREFDANTPTLVLNSVRLIATPVQAGASAVTISNSSITDSALRVWAGELKVSRSTLVRSFGTGEMSQLTLRDSAVRGGWWGQDENEDIVVENSTFDGTGAAQPALRCLSRCSVTEATIRKYTKPLEVAGLATITDSVFADNPNGAIVVDGGDGENTITGSTFRNNGVSAVSVSGRLTLTGSRFTSNALGVDFRPTASLSTVQGNEFTNNRGDGVRSSAEATINFGDNVATRNGGWGLYAPGAADLGGNVARSNTAGDCFGLTCARR